MKQKVLGVLVWLLYSALRATWRLGVIEPEALTARLQERKAVIFAPWHGDELVLLSLIRRYRIATVVSKSTDGEIMATAVALVGGKVSRGSSSRGAVEGLKGLFRLLKAGHSCSMAVDGPRGPLHKVKPGVFELSKKLHLPIYWCGVSCNSSIRFEKSWNKTYLPRPFAKILVEWRGPFGPISETQDPRELALAEKLENFLLQAREEVQSASNPCEEPP